MSYENLSIDELRSAIVQRDQQLKHALAERDDWIKSFERVNSDLNLWIQAFPDNDLHPEQLAEEHQKVEERLKVSQALTVAQQNQITELTCRVNSGDAAYQKVVKENEELNKALQLKLDAAPSGLSAGQSKQMHDIMINLYNLLRAAVCHIPESAMAGSLPRNVKTALSEVERVYNLPTPGTDDHNE